MPALDCVCKTLGNGPTNSLMNNRYVVIVTNELFNSWAQNEIISLSSTKLLHDYFGPIACQTAWLKVIDSGVIVLLNEIVHETNGAKRRNSPINVCSSFMHTHLANTIHHNPQQTPLDCACKCAALHSLAQPCSLEVPSFFNLRRVMFPSIRPSLTSNSLRCSALVVM